MVAGRRGDGDAGCWVFFWDWRCGGHKRVLKPQTTTTTTSLSPRAPHSGALSCFILLFYIRLGAPSVLSENSCANMRACVSSRASSVEVRCLVSASSSSLEFEFGRRKLHRKRTLTSTNQSQSASMCSVDLIGTPLFGSLICVCDTLSRGAPMLAKWRQWEQVA